MKAEAESYLRLVDASEHNTFMTAFAPLLKFAHNSTTNESEMLHKYEGLPLSSIRSCWNKFDTDNMIRIKYMSLILKEAAFTINAANFIHGFLCPENIVFNDLSHKIKFLGCHSVRSINTISDTKKYNFTYSSIYYSLSLKRANLSEEEARDADIKALALSIFELGFDKGISLDSDGLLKDKDGKK